MKYTWVVVTILVAVAVQLAMFFLRLGYFMAFTWGAGLAAVVLITVPAWRNRKSRLAFIAPLYCLSLMLSYVVFFGHKRLDVQPMTWTIKSANNQWKEREVVFEFANHPGQLVGIYSNDVASYLTQNTTNPIDVSFEITSDLGCIRGFHETKIGGLEKWRSAWGYSGSIGASDFPWKSASWCVGG